MCTRYRSGHWRPWPTKRLEGSVLFAFQPIIFNPIFELYPGPYNFVGAAGPMEIKTDCPDECRPPDHKDWNMC